MANSNNFTKSDKITLTAEILAVDRKNNTFTIKLEPTSGSNQAPKIIEIDEIYLSNCMKSHNDNASNTDIPTSLFSDGNILNINRSLVVRLWEELISNANNIDFNDANIDPAMAMEIESSQECDAWFLKECPQTQRLCFILNIYKIWIEAQQCQQTDDKPEFASITDLFSSLKGYSYKQLLNDFHHLKNFHINIKQRDINTDDIYAYFKKQVSKANKCHDRNCRSFSRNTRDRQKCRDSTYRRNLYFIRDRRTEADPAEIQEINVQNLLDTIHSSLIHYDFTEMSLSDKFVTHFEEKSAILNEENDEKSVGKHAGEYGFGIAFKYTAKSAKSSYFCAAKYADLKEELLNNSICPLALFDYESLVNKATQFIWSWNAKKSMIAKSMGTWNEKYNIAADSPARCQHVVVLMSYTNWDSLQRNFKKTYRKIYATEHRREVTLRHREIANWASLLDQCLTFFSERLTDNAALFYHGINCQLKFTQFQAFFLCPTSTTTIPTIAYNFASSRGVVIALGKADSRGPVFVNVSFLSDYPKEEERLIMCNNWSFNNIIYNGTSTKYHVKCLKLFQKIINGSFIRHDKQLFQVKYEKTLIYMMANYMKNNDENTYKIPSYLQTLFNHFCDNIDTIWINEEEFQFFILELQECLIKAPVESTKKSVSGFSKLIKRNKKNDKNMKFGTFSLFLSEKFVNKNIGLQKVSHFKWKIEGKQLESFWSGKQIKGEDIKCNISHLIETNKKDNKFVFYPLCKQHTVKDDGRFRYGLKLESYPHKTINSFTFRFEFCIPEIKFYDGETMESKGKGAVGDNRFESLKLKKLNYFTIQIIISIRSLSFKS